tara:strand:+ start:4699 stop:6345 length:1647 start_codon:yes stop_codon:yes gene_type:complete
MKRRNFLKTTSLSALSIPIVLNGLPFTSLANSPFYKALGNAAYPDRVMVLIQLNGGNDGLNTVIPIEMYPHLTKSNSQGGRSNILVDENDVLKLMYNSIDQSPGTGLHPAMSALSNLFTNGQLNVMQGVGYPNPSFSHFRATDIWLSGSDSNTYEQTGWAGRFLDHEHPNYLTTPPANPLAITIGSISSNAYKGTQLNMGMAVQNPTASGYFSGNIDTAPNSIYGYELEHIRKIAQQSNDYAASLATAYANGQNVATYPSNNSLADQLKTVARLISGDLGTNFYMVNMGSFDTHNDQVNSGDTKTGWHANQLQQLAEAINAFQTDLNSMTNSYGAMQNQVFGMTFSEFGRTIKSNNTNGTDHGTTAPMFLFGNKINPTVLGKNPEVWDSAQGQMKSDLDMQFDFRSIYATALYQWFGLNKGDVDSLFGKTFEDGTNPSQNIYDGGFHCNLPIFLNGGIPIATGVEEGKISASGIYPNPSLGLIKYQGLQSGTYQLQVINNDGKLVHDKQYSSTEMENGLNFGLPRGTYTIIYRNTKNKQQRSDRILIQ